MGIVQVPENRQLFGPLTVEENLELGAYLRAARMSASELRTELDGCTNGSPLSMHDGTKQPARFPAESNRWRQLAAG